MRQISIMLKPGSSACNLRCRYCFYADLAEKRAVPCFGTMDSECVSRILTNVRRDLQPGDQISFAFQGGEPTIVGLSWYEDFLSQAERLLPGIPLSYSLQTNGTLLNEDFAAFLKKHNFLVGLSLDGLPRYHNGARVDRNGQVTYGTVLNAVALLRKYRVEFNILCTLTAEIARHPTQIYKWIQQNDFRYLQFTPCLDELDTPGACSYALQPEKFASFYKTIFPLWYREFRSGTYRSIKLFDDLINLLAYGIPTACGIHGDCQCQLVVEADGSTYPCDFYCLDCYKLGNMQTDSFPRMMASPTAREFLQRPREDFSLCERCPHRSFCGGGCRRMQRQVYYAPGDHYCGFRDFLDDAMPLLYEIALEQRGYR